MNDWSKKSTAIRNSQRPWLFARSLIISVVIAIMAATVVCGADGQPANLPDYTLTLDVGLTEPVVPDITFNIILNIKGVPATGDVTWQYRKQNTTTWTPVAASSGVASVTFPGANVPQVFELQAITGGVTTTKMVKVAGKGQLPGDPVTNPSTYLGMTLVSASIPEGSATYSNNYSFATDHDETPGKLNAAYFCQPSASGDQTLIYSFGSSVTVTGLRIVLDISSGPSGNKSVTYWVGDGGTTWTRITKDNSSGGARTIIPVVTPATGTHFKVVIPGYGDIDRGYRVTEFAVYGTGALWIEQPSLLSTTSTPPVTIAATSSTYWKTKLTDNTLTDFLTNNNSLVKPIGQGDCVFDLGKAYTLTSILVNADQAFTATISTGATASGPWTTAAMSVLNSISAPLTVKTWRVNNISGTRYIKFNVTDGGKEGNTERFYCFKMWGTPVP